LKFADVSEEHAASVSGRRVSKRNQQVASYIRPSVADRKVGFIMWSVGLTLGIAYQPLVAVSSTELEENMRKIA
jgi:hypothetical protein